MLSRGLPALLILATLASAGTTTALEIDPGVILAYGPTTLTTNTTLLPNTLTFDPTTGAPIFNGSLTLDLEPTDGTTTYAWLLDSATTSNVTIDGTPTVNGTFRLAGLNTTTYQTIGVIFTAPFTFGGPDENFTIPAGGPQTIVIMPTAPIPNGSRLVLSSTYSPDSQTIGSTVSIVSPNGTAITDIPVLLTILDPNGTVIGTTIMTQTTVHGVYRATTPLANTTTLGNYVTIASVGDFVNSQSVRVDAPIGTNASQGRDQVLSLTTSIDQWLPTLFWGGLILFALYLNAWFPVIVGVMALLDSIIPNPVMNFVGRVMLVTIGWIIHSLAVNGILPTPWSKKESQ